MEGVQVHHQDRLPSVPRFGDGIKIGEVETGVPRGSPQAGILMRHGSSSPLCQISKEICFRQAGESRNTRDTGGLQSGGSAPGAKLPEQGYRSKATGARLPETSFIGAIL